MRKKTIEEELREIAEEKEDHIEQLEKQFGHSKAHSYDFSPEEDSSSRKNSNVTLSENNMPENNVTEKEDALKTDTPLQSSQSISAQFEKLRQAHAQAVKTSSKKTATVGSIFAALIFLMAGLGISIFGGIVPWVKSATYISVSAVVVDVDFYTDSDGDKMGRPTYQYEVGGTTYTKKSSFSQNASLCPSIGETVSIKVNPNNPEEILDDTFIHIILTFFGLPFAGVGIFLMTVSIKAFAKKKRS